MPNDNQNNTNQNPPKPAVPSIFPQADLPPLAPEFQNSGSSGSAAPQSPPPVITPAPKKKFGGGRIIATILGILLLVGGIGAGILLTGQPQLFQQKASTIDQCFNDSDCASNEFCSKLISGNVCKPRTNNTTAGPANCTPNCTNKVCGSNGCGGSCGTCASGKTCSSGQCMTGTSTCGVGTPGGAGASCSCVLDCQNGFACTSGKCTSSGQEGSACSATMPCANNTLTCSGGQCVLVNNTSGSCFNDANCSAGAICIGGKCQVPTGGSGSVCNSTHPCSSGFSCDNSTNKCVAATTGTCPVGQGYVVATGQCQAPVGNCASYGPGPGKCFVTTAIGATSDGSAVCDAGGHWTTCAQGYTCSNNDCIPPTGCTGAGCTGNQSATCQNIKAYSSTWTLLTSAQLSALKPDTEINFCLTASATNGTFDLAKFTINGTVGAETSTKGQGAAAGGFCQSYKIKATDTSMTVSAQVHHSTLGWF